MRVEAGKAVRDGSRALAAAVVQQALEDAPMTSSAKSPDRQTARSLLFSDRPEWVEARRFWFTIAGVREPSRDVLLRAAGVAHEKASRRAERAATRCKAAVAWLNRGATTRGKPDAASEAPVPHERHDVLENLENLGAPA